jgi:hypothetical protein
LDLGVMVAHLGQGGGRGMAEALANVRGRWWVGGGAQSYAGLDPGPRSDWAWAGPRSNQESEKETRVGSGPGGNT